MLYRVPLLSEACNRLLAFVFEAPKGFLEEKRTSLFASSSAVMAMKALQELFAVQARRSRPTVPAAWQATGQPRGTQGIYTLMQQHGLPTLAARNTAMSARTARGPPGADRGRCGVLADALAGNAFDHGAAPKALRLILLFGGAGLPCGGRRRVALRAAGRGRLVRPKRSRDARGHPGSHILGRGAASRPKDRLGQDATPAEPGSGFPAVPR